MTDFVQSKRTREFLENLIDATRGPVLLLNQELRVFSVSRAFYQVFHVTPRQTIGSLIFELGNRQWDIPRLRELLETILPRNASFKDYEVEHTFATIGRRTMLLNARQIDRVLGTKPAILLAVEDITTRKEVEKAVEVARHDLSVRADEEARELAQSIIDTIREPLVSLDQDLRVVAVSRAFYDVFHVNADQTIGQVIFDLGNGQWNIPRLRELLDAILLQATTFNNYEVVHEFSSIGRRTMLLNARRVNRSMGREKIILLAIEDITERRYMEAELQKSQRVESLGVLAGGIAHDFNNLMAGLMANNELAKTHLLAGRTAEALARIERIPAIFARGRALTRRLLTFSKGGAPTRSTTALEPLLREWVDFALMGADVTATLDIETNLWLCDCDVGQVSQVINNLLINARQASNEGGVIKVDAYNVLKGGRFVCIKITNGGTRIPPEIIGKIFDPFFTTKSEGSGLGLAIAYSIIRQHEGWIDVQSDEKNGTSLSVFLPATSGVANLDRLSPTTEEFTTSGVALVMDDDPDILEAVGEMMTGVGFEVYRAKTGEELLTTYLEIIKKGLKVKVFLLDSQIPGGMGGVATAKKLRELGSMAQVVLMSGHYYGVSSAFVSEADGLWRIAKPFTKGELVQVLSSASAGF